MKQLPASDGMDILRTLTSALGQCDPTPATTRRQANYRKAVRLTAQLGSLVATTDACTGAADHPDPALGHAANFLYMLSGTAERVAEHAFDVALVLHADHELNASTFAAGCRCDADRLYSATVAAIGTLKGPLHGGANADVMRLLIEIGPDAPPERVDEAIRAKLAKKIKIPGFGHRVYRTEDPRATHLRRMSK